MVEYLKEREVLQCYHGCPFFSFIAERGLICSHPEIMTKSTWEERLIITEKNSRGGKVPDECPLRKSPLKVITEIRLKQD